MQHLARRDTVAAFVQVTDEGIAEAPESIPCHQGENARETPPEALYGYSADRAVPANMPQIDRIERNGAHK